MFKINNKDTRSTPWHRSSVFIVNFEHFTPYSSVSIVNFEHVIASWNVCCCCQCSEFKFNWNVF